ncbi:signal transduction histidine kinase [Paenibacillus phyllosphaerae]|uniref:histidine kinase n=1 Tax=Paenibacillus phyllosphaerae TaxID=274593 RepID=A0A7W5FNN5_9BACL|nr:HAMP domain-containing sensor histidine kinase [Paenibacillus phyllosphaerae]MBB3111373.1 signal transduction histidine kinase [Paenibacillus phyllosphaerae]
MVRRRLAVRFGLQLAGAGLLLVVLAAVILVWILAKFEEIEIRRNFAPTGISRLISKSQTDDNGLIADPVLLERLRQDGGWLQSLDDDGNVIQSFNAPGDLPERYVPGQLMDYWIGGEPYPYRLGLWIQEKEGVTYTLLYGSRSPTEDLLSRLIDDGKLEDGRLAFSAATLEMLGQRDGWVQVLDRNGHEIASWERPEESPTTYALQDLALQIANNDGVGTLMDTRYDQKTGYTWVYQYPMSEAQRHAMPIPGMMPEVQVMIGGLVAFLLGALLLFIVLSIWYANRFGTPLIHILGAIRRLGAGVYPELPPQQPKRRKFSFRRKDSRKRRNRIFGEVFESLETLTAALRTGREAAERTQRTREEWIAGVTHDMKTPLASIQGYAHMMAAGKYSWTEEEVRKFASVILEKSEYMDKLINDLSLTYRLRSGDLPVEFEMLDVRDLLQEAVIRASGRPEYEAGKVQCSVPSTTVLSELHPPWFERIVDNLVANAFLHNPPETVLSIALTHGADGQSWRIDFADNGKGMDEETLERLFDRYYRGLNTESGAEGSGLGMAVAKELVQAMGGRIEAHSELGQGTVVSLIWDRRDGERIRLADPQAEKDVG